ncbi:MAG TPA: hypothetical protein VGE01_00245, partial [Fimbriimonas sp.]
FIKFTVPNRPTDAAADFYATLMHVPQDRTVMIQSDWTNSSRGESGGSFEALVRILMRRGLKFALYSADPQSPQVARDVITRINDERIKEGKEPYRSWNDYLVLGYMPAVDVVNKAMATNLRKAFSDRQATSPGVGQRNVFESPVLNKVQKFNDLGLFVVVTASNTSITAIERLSGQKTPMMLMVTGVMGPEHVPYYASGQVKGLVVGLKGVYDMETMMQNGINFPDAASAKVRIPRYDTVPGFPGETNFGKGNAYYPTLHVALTLLILAVVIGNVGMFLSRRQR